MIILSFKVGYGTYHEFYRPVAVQFGALSSNGRREKM